MVSISNKSFICWVGTERPSVLVKTAKLNDVKIFRTFWKELQFNTTPSITDGCNKCLGSQIVKFDFVDSHRIPSQALHCIDKSLKVFSNWVIIFSDVRQNVVSNVGELQARQFARVKKGNGFLRFTFCNILEHAKQITYECNSGRFQVGSEESTSFLEIHTALPVESNRWSNSFFSP